MELSISTLMMLFFIVAVTFGMWKIYAFLPNKKLEDDDRTKEAEEHLLKIIKEIIETKNEDFTRDQLFVWIVEHEEFESQKYWRFNKNRLNGLLELYALKYPHAKKIL